MTFGQRLKKLREEKDISREDLAQKLGISYWTLSKYETDNRSPDYETLSHLADYFNVSTDYLLGRTDNPRQEMDDTSMDPDIRAIARAAQKMPPEQRKDLARFLKKAFDETFKDS